ncbi:PolC-type DNA polymerase III [Geothrix sp. 21YS21S-4]|uniref:3'-5' exonuclease n=1 Tax=Geothrix sp. 21YS21S-4 TaxID=3068889 RepID=UPI0027B9C950|nr:3'-5' exonuclease [Geothrix sp. 21YS21S-4]
MIQEPLLETGSPALRELRFAVLDLETTGGSPKSRWNKEGRFIRASEITEVGVVGLSGMVVEDRFSSLAAIEGFLPEEIQRLTGISLPMLAGAPPWEQVALKVAPRLEGRVWVAHYAPYDGSFLKAWLPEGIWRRHRLICTRLLAKELLPELPKRSLADVCAHLGITNTRAHRALQDAEATAEALQCLIQRAEDRGLDGEAFLRLGEVAWNKV